MSWLHRLISWSVENRLFVLLGVVAFVGVSVASLRSMTFDAFPDLTNVQVQVLTASPGMGSEEVEVLVTAPLERALGGTPGMEQIRSISRTGISSVTVVFEDGTEVWRARQLVKERVDQASGSIPATAGRPEIAPPTTGLGEVYQFTLTSDRHTLPELTRLLERDIGPRLRGVPGVVEVNVWGGGAPQLEVTLDPFKLASYGLTPQEVEARLGSSLGVASGGAEAQGDEQTLVRAVANPTDAASLEGIALRGGAAGGPALRVQDVGEAREGKALTVGMGSADGQGEGLFVMVQLLAGADALGVVQGVRERVEEVQSGLPEGVRLEPIYDREKLVGSTLRTVARSLIEGGLLVIVVLFVLLGDLRAGLLVASVIPLAMLGAFLGLNLLGYTGNLMSLGAIDFGLIVDGTIVVTESIVALTVARGEGFGAAVAERAKAVSGPVLFAVGILILVYTPILLMWGVEGKLFRPMALTVLLALGTALVLSFTYVPAMASWVIQPRGEHMTWVIAALRRLYRPTLEAGLRRPGLAAGLAAAVLVLSGWVGAGLGVEFVPRLQEGDLVVQTARLPSLSPAEALRGASQVEASLQRFPEVERVASRSGAPALATDPMGLEEADILVKLAPRERWSHPDLESLVAAMAAQLEVEAPGAELNFTQPIEMRFNELLQGITSDVGVKIYGPDHARLRALGQEVAQVLGEVEGAADVVPPAQEGVPGIEVRPRPEALARYGLEASAVLELVAGLQRGVEVGAVMRGQFQDPVVMKVRLPAGVPLADMPVVLPSGRSVPLGEVAEVLEVRSPARIDREAGSRRVVVRANVRGRDLGGYVVEAQRRVAAEVELPEGYWVEWSGKYEQLQAALTRTLILVPALLFLILGVLYGAFKGFKPALLIFLNVPVAASGGVMMLEASGLPLSMSAIVGFIALFGVAVMNGIVLLSRTRELHRELGAVEAARESALERFRPVLMTALVAGLGFIPMMVATGVGAEVQRPLATVVIGGLVTSTLLTLVVLPALYGRLFRGEDSAARSGAGREVGDAGVGG